MSIIFINNLRRHIASILGLLLFVIAVVAVGFGCLRAHEQSAAPRERDPFYAAEHGDLQSLKALVEANPGILDDSKGGGWTLLHYAADGNQPEVIGYLVDQGMGVDSRNGGGYTPLHTAAMSAEGSFEAAKMLIDLRADPKGRTKRSPNSDHEGPSVLDIAASRGHFALVQLLLEKGAPAREKNSSYQGWRDSALHRACMNSIAPKYRENPATAGNQKVIDLLAKKIGNINVLNYRRETPLHHAASWGAIETVRHLLENYPELDIDAQAGGGDTPLHRAAHTDGIDVRVEERATIVELLLDHGAKTDLRNSQGYTPLEWARKHADPKIVRAFKR